MSLRTSFRIAALAAAALAAAGAPALAQQPSPAPSPASAADKEQARLLHQEGLRYYSAGQYGRAITAYRKAYSLVPAPGILFNLAQAYRLRGDCRRAHRAYRSFLRVGGNSPEIDLAREHARALRACAQKMETEKGAVDTVGDPVPPLGTPASTDPALAQPIPPPVTPPAAAVEPAPAPAPISPPSDSGPRDDQAGQNKKLVGLGVGGAGIALAAVGLYYGFKARGEASDLSNFFDDGGMWTPAYAEKQDAFDRHRTLAIGFGLIGTGAIATGAVLYWLGHREDSRLDSADQGPVSIAPQPDGALVVWRGDF